MSFKHWKLGLIIASITGFFSAFVAGMVFPEATWKQLLFVLLASIGKDVVLYLKDHPSSSVKFDSEVTDPDGTTTKTTIEQSVTDKSKL